MRRRDFIAGLMFTSTMGRAQAQQTGKVFRIAFAHPTTPVADINQASKGSLVIPAIFEELIRLGYVEGRNLLIERYSGEGRAAHYPELVRAVVSRNPDLIIAISNNLVLPRFQSGDHYNSNCRSLCQSGRNWHRSEPGKARRQYHRGFCKCRFLSRAVGQTDSTVAAGGAGGQIGVPSIAKNEGAGGAQGGVELVGSYLGWPAVRPSDRRGWVSPRVRRLCRGSCRSGRGRGGKRKPIKL